MDSHRNEKRWTPAERNKNYLRKEKRVEMDREILESLGRIEQSLAILVRAQLGPVLQEEVSDKRMAELWKITGNATQREVKKRLNMSADTISAAWQRWERLGLLVKDGKEYRRVI